VQKPGGWGSQRRRVKGVGRSSRVEDRGEVRGGGHRRAGLMMMVGNAASL